MSDPAPSADEAEAATSVTAPEAATTAEDAEAATSGTTPDAAAGADSAPPWTPPPLPPTSGAADSPAAALTERPEIAAGAAFAGGFALALILKRLAR
ncbi:MAG: hypothetical protein M3016_05380 [Actinomycetota bacterium]|nr:hypothetical protein [Actinomycetota bacterium]